MSINIEEYPYFATWAETLEEAGPPYTWTHWNGISMTPPTFVRYQGVTYTYEQFKQKFWGFKNMKHLVFPTQKTHPKAIIPKKIKGNVAFDLHVVPDEEWNVKTNGVERTFTLEPWKSHLFHTGIKMAIPAGKGVLYRDRSGLAGKYNIHHMAGAIDCTYRGEWMIKLINLSDNPYTFHEGDRIIQCVIVDEYSIDFLETKDLDDTERGEKGFGSSGR